MRFDTRRLHNDILPITSLNIQPENTRPMLSLTLTQYNPPGGERTMDYRQGRMHTEVSTYLDISI